MRDQVIHNLNVSKCVHLRSAICIQNLSFVPALKMQEKLLMLLGTFELNSLNSTFPGWPFTKLQEVINPEFHDIKTWERNKWMLNRRQEERYGTGNSVTERRDWPTAGLVAWYCPRVNPGTAPRSRFPSADLDCCQWRGCEVQTGGWWCEGGGGGGVRYNDLPSMSRLLSVKLTRRCSPSSHWAHTELTSQATLDWPRPTQYTQYPTLTLTTTY